MTIAAGGLSVGPRFARGTVLTAVAALAVFVLTLASVKLRPIGADWSAWAPAAGVAVGIVSRFSVRTSWIPTTATIFGSLAANFLAGANPIIATGGAIASGVSTWAACWIIRSRDDRDPRLVTPYDLFRLIAAVLVGSLGTGILTGLVAAVVFTPSAFAVLFISLAPNAAAGMLLIWPFFLVSQSTGKTAGLIESTALWILTAVTIGLTFGVTSGLPVAFLSLVPIVWGAVRLTRFFCLLQLLLVAVGVSYFTTNGVGAFGGSGLSTQASTLMVQLFDIVCAIVLLTLAISVSRELNLAAALVAREALMRDNFELSLSGRAIVRLSESRLLAYEVNPAGRKILGATTPGAVELAPLLSEESTAQLLRAAVAGQSDSSRRWSGFLLTPAYSRTLEASFAPLPVALAETQFALEFFDITDRLRAAEAESRAADLERAAEVQRALLPKDALPLPGYEVAGGCAPTRSVGGDFYDWYSTEDGLAITLGDVMGKGLGAGMIAAEVRLALRTDLRSSEAGRVVTKAAALLESDLAEASTFVTLFHARIRSSDGQLSYADAGHGLSLLVRVDGAVTRMSGKDFPIGAVSHAKWFGHSETMNPGDTLVSVSDGVLDLFDGDRFDGDLIALERIAAYALAAASSQDLVDTIMGQAAPGATDDDVTVLVVRRDLN